MSGEPYGAVARFWLAMLHYQKGEDSHGDKQLLDALTLNPFVAPPPLLDDLPLMSLHRDAYTANDRSWAVRLSPDRIDTSMGLMKGDSIPLLRVRGLRSTMRNKSWWTHQSGVNLGTISAAAYHPVLTWSPAPSIGEPSREVLSVFDASTGNALWHDIAAGDRFWFATPRVIVLKPDKSDEYYWLLDPISGEPVSSMSLLYLETVFSPLYRDEHQSFTDSTRQYTLHKSELIDSVKGSSQGGHREERSAVAPLQIDVSVVGFNQWTYSRPNLSCTAGFGVVHVADMSQSPELAKYNDHMLRAAELVQELTANRPAEGDLADMSEAERSIHERTRQAFSESRQLFNEMAFGLLLKDTY